MYAMPTRHIVPSLPLMSRGKAVDSPLKALRAQRGLSQEDAAARISELSGDEVGQAALSYWELGKVDFRKVHPRRLRAYAEVLCVSTGQLAAAIGLPESDLFLEAPPSGGTRKLLHTDKVEILVFAMASANPDGICSDQPPSSSTLVSPRFARSNHCAYLVDGDSMDGGDKPIRHGDVVIVDRGLRDLVDNRIYVVKVHGNGILLKRVRIYDGVPELQSDNRAHRTLRPDEAQILGMVVKVVPQEFDPY